MSTFDPAAFDRWLTTQPDDSIERGALEDTLAEKIINLFDEINVRLPEGVLATAVTYAADLAEAYVAEVTATCDRCGLPIDEDNSAKDRQDPTIWVCAGGYGCDTSDVPDDIEPEPNYYIAGEDGLGPAFLSPVPTELLGLLVAGLQRLVWRDDKRAAKGKPRLLSPYEVALITDAVGTALSPNFALYYGVR